MVCDVPVVERPLPLTSQWNAPQKSRRVLPKDIARGHQHFAHAILRDGPEISGRGEVEGKGGKSGNGHGQQVLRGGSHSRQKTQTYNPMHQHQWQPSHSTQESNRITTITSRTLKT
uniref:Uncharacterized protein n=1 Tax=Lepeophtheirus salmonis TaxID=72036 RepID=A0A0K2UFL7_LEPSM